MTGTEWTIDYNNPRVLETQQEVDIVNSIKGNNVEWKVGDHCYWVKPHADSYYRYIKQ